MKMFVITRVGDFFSNKGLSLVLILNGKYIPDIKNTVPSSSINIHISCCIMNTTFVLQNDCSRYN